MQNITMPKRQTSVPRIAISSILGLVLLNGCAMTQSEPTPTSSPQQQLQMDTIIQQQETILAMLQAQPGQFNVPHGIGSDGERLYVADRENSRVQVFNAEGELLAVWDDVARPAQVHVARDGLVYVFELGFHTGIFPWNTPDTSKPSGRMSIFDRHGKLLARWGGNGFPTTPEEFYAPHDVFVDSTGSFYTAEVKAAAAKFVGDDTSTLPSLRKFARRGG